MVFETGDLGPLTAVKSAEGVWVELLDKNEPLMFSLLPTSGKKPQINSTWMDSCCLFSIKRKEDD